MAASASSAPRDPFAELRGEQVQAAQEFEGLDRRRGQRPGHPVRTAQPEEPLAGALALTQGLLGQARGGVAQGQGEIVQELTGPPVHVIGALERLHRASRGRPLLVPRHPRPAELVAGFPQQVAGPLDGVDGGDELGGVYVRGHTVPPGGECWRHRRRRRGPRTMPERPRLPGDGGLPPRMAAADTAPAGSVVRHAMGARAGRPYCCEP
ncbi:hypothetical protein GCM10020254_10800 [Streptomyces goshikiensis]